MYRCKYYRGSDLLALRRLAAQAGPDQAAAQVRHVWHAAQQDHHTQADHGAVYIIITLCCVYGTVFVFVTVDECEDAISRRVLYGSIIFLDNIRNTFCGTGRTGSERCSKPLSFPSFFIQFGRDTCRNCGYMVAQSYFTINSR